MEVVMPHRVNTTTKSAKEILQAALQQMQVELEIRE
jgi:hypothetical protein